MPRRSGTTTVWSFASSAAIGDHMSPVLPKPWISTTAGPWPPTRTLIVASAFTTCELRKSVGKGVGAACADRALSARLAARPAATRRKRRENVDETVAAMFGSLAAINSSGLVPFSPSNAVARTLQSARRGERLPHRQPGSGKGRLTPAGVTVVPLLNPREEVRGLLCSRPPEPPWFF